MTNTALRPPLTYYGGKTSLAARIAALLPAHTHYVEPFAGSLAVLLAKTPARMETVNDRDGDLMCFWRVLRDRPGKLERACALTPHARAEHAAAHGDLTGLDDLERARRVWIRLTQGRAGTMRTTGWRHYADPAGSSASMPRYLTGYLDRMQPAADRLAGVSLECRDAFEVIATYGRHRQVLLYIDPPYPGPVRHRNYRHELTTETAHRELAAALHTCRATVVLSGYPCQLYDHELYPDWHRHTLQTGTSQGGPWEARTEVLWSNRPLHTTREPPLFTPDDPEQFRNTDPEQPDRCNETRCGAADCRKVLRQPATGRRRTYCSPACRVRAHRAARGGRFLSPQESAHD